KIIENPGKKATGSIYNLGNPDNTLSIRELAETMVAMAREYPEYRDKASKVKLVETTSGNYYGKGYQDIQHRRPDIRNTTADLGWEPKVAMRPALAQIFEAYRMEIGAAGDLLTQPAG
ncbi:MAG: bifunctional UDP-4-keto-pentose/UDP-xylose synthase, partial [Gammaproteobacteria bacterium]